MPDLVVLEAQRVNGKCFHYTFTGLTPTQLHGQWFPGNRCTVPLAYATTMLDPANNPPAAPMWRQVADYNVDPYPPPGWPAPGSIPQIADAGHEAATHSTNHRRRHIPKLIAEAVETHLR